METVKFHSRAFGCPCVTASMNETGAAEVIWAVVVVRIDHLCGSVFSVMRDGVIIREHVVPFARRTGACLRRG